MSKGHNSRKGSKKEPAKSMKNKVAKRKREEK
jgi:hypothetical protein